jgi:hypothetical protein
LENGVRAPRYPDVTIHLANFPPLSAHAIFLSRSPYLNSLLLNQPPSPPYTINLPTSDPNLTYDSLLNTLQYLYTPSSCQLPDESTIISNIASACILGIYPQDLVDSYRHILLKINLTPQSIHHFISFLLSSPHQIDPPTSHPGPYPPFTQGLLSNVLNYFITTLPIQLQSPSTALPATANTELYKQMLLPLPFDILKHILEHPSLPIGSEKQRYELAKQIVTRRRKEEIIPVEESVILKVGGNDGEGVQLVRSFARKRALWKTHHNPRSRNSTSGSK